MTTTVWGVANDVTVADASETVVVSVTTRALDVSEQVMLRWGRTDEGANDVGGPVNMRVRRDDVNGPQIGPTINVEGAGFTGGLLQAACSPLFDGPGLAESTTYVLTIEEVGASDPSTGIDVSISATYN